MEVKKLIKLYSFSYSTQEDKAYTISVYEVHGNPLVKYVVKIKKPNGKETLINFTTPENLLQHMRSYGSDVFEDFVKNTSERMRENNLDEPVEPQEVIDTINANALHQDRHMPIMRTVPLVGDVVEDVRFTRLGVVELIEYIGVGRFPIYHVTWEDGTRSTMVGMQLRVVIPNSEVPMDDKGKIEWRKVKEALIKRERPMDPFANLGWGEE